MLKHVKDLKAQILSADPQKVDSDSYTTYSKNNPIHIHLKEFKEEGTEIIDRRRVCKRADYGLIDLEENKVYLFSYYRNIEKLLDVDYIDRQRVLWALQHGLCYDDRYIIIYAVFH